MPTLNIQGKRVKVSDDFLRLSPEDQNAAVDEIASSLGGQEQPLSPAAQEFASEASRITQGFERDRGDSRLRNVDSFMRGAADVLSIGLSDEISAGLGAVTGLGGTFGDYSGNMRRQRIEQELRDRNDPVASTAGRVAGAVGSGYGLTKAGLTFTGNLASKAGLGSRVIAGAKDGALYGGAYGFGSGEGFEDRTKQAVGGAVAGGLIGGAIPGVVAGVKAVAKPVTDAVKARVNPGGYASQKVAERLGASNQTPQSIANKLRSNPGSTVADVGGKSARDLLRTAVNIPGPAKDRVAKQVTLRQFGQGDRLKKAIGRTFADPDGYLNAKDELADAAKRLAGPIYEKAYQQPVHFSQELENILKTPAGQKALANAVKLAANEQQPFKQVFINIQGQAKRVPDTRGWDYIKRAMDDMIESQTDPITRKVTNEGRILVSLKNRMLAEVDKYNPYFKQARSIYGGVAQIDDAMEFGRKAMGMSPHAVKRALNGMTASQKEAARIGAAEELRKAIDQAGLTHNAVLKIFGNRQKIDNLRALFDNDAQFREFRQSIFQEARKRATYEAVKGNSTTASQLADMMEAGGLSEVGGFAGNTIKNGPVSATLQWVGSRLRMLGGLTPKVADEIAQRLMNTDPAQTRMLMNELMKIEQQQLSAAARSQMVQQLISRALTATTVGAIGQSH